MLSNDILDNDLKAQGFSTNVISMFPNYVNTFGPGRIQEAQIHKIFRKLGTPSVFRCFQSFVQNSNSTNTTAPQVKQAADEFVQSTAQNILDIKELNQLKNTSQQLT